MRLSDWPERLNAYVEAHLNTPHTWGTHDCALFAAGAVEAMTGVNPSLPFRGRYSSRHEALRLLAEEGGFETLLTKTFGEPISVLQARRGDLLFGRLNTEDGLAVCLGTKACAPGARHTAHDQTVPGLAFLPLERFRIAFRVD